MYLTINHYKSIMFNQSTLLQTPGISSCCRATARNHWWGDPRPFEPCRAQWWWVGYRRSNGPVVPMKHRHGASFEQVGNKNHFSTKSFHLITSRLGNAMFSQHPPIGAHVSTAAQVCDDGSANANVSRGGVVVQLLMPLFLFWPRCWLSWKLTNPRQHIRRHLIVRGKRPPSPQTSPVTRQNLVPHQVPAELRSRYHGSPRNLSRSIWSFNTSIKTYKNMKTFRIMQWEEPFLECVHS